MNQPKNKNAQALGRKSWEARKKKMKDPSKYFSDLSKGKKPEFDKVDDTIVEK